MKLKDYIHTWYVLSGIEWSLMGSDLIIQFEGKAETTSRRGGSMLLVDHSRSIDQSFRIQSVRVRPKQ